MEKLVKQHYLLHMSPQYGELRPTNGWDLLASLGHPTIFNGFRVLASLLQRRRSTEANQTLHDVWPSPELVHHVYIFGDSLPSDGILSRAKLTLRACLAFSYIGSVAARHSSSGPQPNFAAWYTEWNYRTFGWAAITLGIGPHSNNYIIFPV